MFSVVLHPFSWNSSAVSFLVLLRHAITKLPFHLKKNVDLFIYKAFYTISLLKRKRFVSNWIRLLIELPFIFLVLFRLLKEYNSKKKHSFSYRYQCRMKLKHQYFALFFTFFFLKIQLMQKFYSKKILTFWIKDKRIRYFEN